MCIQTRIQKAILEKAALDAKIAKLEKLEAATAPVKNLLSELLADYATEAPEELAGIWSDILAIGQQYQFKFGISPQPLTAEELQQWEAANAENKKLKQQLEAAQAEITEQDKAWGELSDERDDLEEKLAKLRSQMPTPTIRAEYELATGNDASELTVDSILTAKGFFQPPDLEDYDASHKYETYRGWDIYCSLPNGGIVSIGLYNAEYNQAWDASTEYIEEIDPTFPESLADYDEIVKWTRALIDQVENLQASGQLALEFPSPETELETVLTDEEYDAAVEEELALDDEIPELGGNWEKVIENYNNAKPTELQKVLFENDSSFVFEPAQTGGNVKTFVGIHSQITPADDTVDFATEEARFDVAIFEGGFQGDYEKKAEYFLDAQTFLYHHRADIRQAALGYAKYFWQELEKKAEIKEKVAHWNADTTLSSNQTAPEPIAESANTESANPEIPTKAFEAMGFAVIVYPQYAGENLVGATFRVLTPEEMGADGKPRLVFATSLLAAEMGELPYKVVAEQLIMNYQAKEADRLEKLANPYKKPEDDFIEFVRLTPAVGYIKRRDNGELISAYAAFSNRDAAGEKTETLAKPRAKKWVENFRGSFESCGWKIDEPRKVKRMESEPGAKQQFAYEIKITGKFSIGQLQKLAEEDFSLLPNEIKVYKVKVNSYEHATGALEEMQKVFSEELAKLGGSHLSVAIGSGATDVLEVYRIMDFNFIEAQDFDSDNPEYEVTHLPSQKTFKVYKRVGVAPAPTGWTNTIYPYSPGFTKREAAAADAVRRLLKAQNAE